MTSHCHCPSEDQDPVIREIEVNHPAEEVMRAEECVNCGGLIRCL